MESENDQAMIEREFSESWDLTEEIYSSVHWISWKPSVPLLNLITQLREQGYDKTLRAGKSLSRFILSRSRYDGLRRNQARLGFDLHSNGTMNLLYFEPPDKEIQITVESLTLTPEVEDLLARLLSHPID